MTWEASCGCVPGFRRCDEANGQWESANAVYRARGYDAWMDALCDYREHNERVELEYRTSPCPVHPEHAREGCDLGDHDDRADFGFRTTRRIS